MNADTLTKIKAEKDQPCISVIIPTHRLSPERATDPIEVKKILKQVRDGLTLTYGKNGVMKLADKLEQMAGSIDYNHNLDGIGFFVSPAVAEIVHFPFPVKEKVLVGEKFEIRDLLYMQSMLQDYYVLSLNGEGAKLYKGNGTHLEEVINNEFPKDFVDDYEYAKPSLASGHDQILQSTEGDKSIVIEERYQRFLKDVDKDLAPFLVDHAPLILSGVEEELGFFRKVTRHEKQISGAVVGNYHFYDMASFGKMTFDEVMKFRQQQNEEQIEKLSDSIGKELAVTGIHSVWRAAQEGKGLLLMVEKDFIKRGFLKEGDVYNLYLSPPVEKHEILQDVVETIIETVTAKHGKVMLVENGTLTEFDQIAMILRYT